MRPYRHALHAGNQADVFKHAVLTLLLDALLATRSEPLVYLESHAGAGVYDLTHGRAFASAEQARGIGRLWTLSEALPELGSYLGAIAALNPDGRVARYPGSPQLARHRLRVCDRLVLFELQEAEASTLQMELGVDPRVSIHLGDGFAGVPELLPPSPAQGLVLIDPPYVSATDFMRVPSCLATAHQRWPAGVYAVWYPRLAGRYSESDRLLRGLQQTFGELLVAELAGLQAAADSGLQGAGVALMNPPSGFDRRLKGLLPRLLRVLRSATGPPGAGPPAGVRTGEVHAAGGQDPGTGWRVEWRRRAS